MVLKPPDNIDRALQAVRKTGPGCDERHKDVPILQQRDMEGIRQDSHNDVGRAIDPDGLVQRDRAGDGAGKALAHDRHSGSGRRVLWKEIATSSHLYAKQSEESGGQLGTAEHSRLIAESDGEVPAVIALEATEAVRARSPVEEGGIRG